MSEKLRDKIVSKIEIAQHHIPPEIPASEYLTNQILSIPITRKCGECGGTGRISKYNSTEGFGETDDCHLACPTCGGKGTGQVSRSIGEIVEDYL